MTCFRYYDILAKTRSRMETVTTFSYQNEAGSRPRITLGPRAFDGSYSGIRILKSFVRIFSTIYFRTT